MKYKKITFEAIMATPSCGKSYLCDKYPNLFVDADELRLKLKYEIPENLSRQEMESSKGERPFPRRLHGDKLNEEVFKKLDELRQKGITIIAAPHPEMFEYFKSRNIAFCFVYPNKNMKEEIKRRMVERNNPESTINSNYENFEVFYESNTKDTIAAVHYEFGENEYLEDIMKKFGYNFK